MIAALLLLCFLFVDATQTGYKFQHAPISLISESDAQLTVSTPSPNRVLLTQVEKDALATDIVNKYGSTFSPIFLGDAFYPTSEYITFQGKDDTSIFASQVLVKEDTVFVGMNGYNAFAGAVVVYTRTNSTEWVETSMLEAPEGPHSNFGVSLDKDGEWLAVGANAVDIFTGVVYLYQYFDGYWILNEAIQPPMSLSPHSGFGSKVALHGNTLVVASAFGEVFVYEILNGQWEIRNPQQLPSPSIESQFGFDLALQDDLLVVGAPNHTYASGAVFVFQRQSAQNWMLVTTIDSVTGWNARFGHSVALYDRTIAVGAVGFVFDTYESTGVDTETNTGNVYLFDVVTSGLLRRLDTAPQWTLTQKIASPLGRASYFGASVDLFNGTLIVGANGFPYSNVSGSDMLGGAFVYAKPLSSSLQQYQLQAALPSPAGKLANFGFAVSVHNGVAAVGAFGDKSLAGSVTLAKIEPFLSSATSTTTNNINSLGAARSSFQFNSWLVYALLAILAVVVAVALGFCFKCCGAPVTTGTDKKKKKEEEESPYTVHSYTGYCEIDDALPPQYSPSVSSRTVLSIPSSHIWSVAVPAPPPSGKEDSAMAKKMSMDKQQQSGAEKDAKSKDKTMTTTMTEDGLIIESATEGFVRRLFPYKVFGPRGYVEGQDVQDYNELQIQEKIAMEERLRRHSPLANMASSSRGRTFRENTLIRDDDEGEGNKVEDLEEIGSRLDDVLDCAPPSLSSNSAPLVVDRDAQRAMAEEQARARFAQLKNKTAESRRTQFSPKNDEDAQS